ncbi:3-deoxy-D-manno-octulosonic-acid transferase [Sulfurivirga caldicuralii]|uniref:3-deoxy-D-manno-octulosonic acid transferase n=1 Tax=Sulfurivirga caldicuralii TaxID=364032 RepID=A0A1N6DD40_9GAMM|nr:glycosyltransferase N-terminal domain-containing protein [Sulfurivirga caldicuralii]SIN68729.1 3-deoxy-D-manno-octulosonic-acid transferase [Sulfurivirga caldicuralii]
MRAAYSTLLALLSPWLESRLQRARQGGPRLFSPPDFSALETRWKTAEKRPIWLHCASAGEVTAAQPLIQRLQQTGTPFYVTVFSANGADKLIQLYGEQVPWGWLPLDTRGNMRDLLQRLQPQHLWLLESELWPNMLASAHAAGVPITLINARVGGRNRRAPTLLRRLWREVVPLFDRVLARGQEDAAWFEQLGVPAERIAVLGNLKWYSARLLADASPQPLRQVPYHLFASAYVEEMDAFFPAIAERKDLLPWVVVPRRTRDVDAMVRKAEDADLRVCAVDSDETARNAEADCLIETRFGNLTRWIAGAHSVVMGGSFAPFGGHNFLEAAALGLPVITGPDMGDFEAETALFLQQHALLQTETPEKALDVLSTWVRHPEQGEALGQRARALLHAEAEGIARRYFDALNL